MAEIPGLNEECFWRHVVKQCPTSCWEWTARRSEDGYGRYTFTSEGQKKDVGAHRLAYVLSIGPIGDGLTLDHRCRNRGCVNPDHLEPVTRRVNVLRGDTFASRQAAQTHCASGHEFTPENTYVWNNHRYCRTCRRENRRRADAKRRAKKAALTLEGAAG
ncbi:hypothetical protein RVR_10508 [Actinacidiphila reveromycinica]|uniref:HNH nuclease domain-containing protein n=1 Tax=Actinacidiphila reveromycinica TaxID=659352 RepID=A0A7U3UQ31_9ACTN|nr:HNH endonuclease signature motif containing protein [Streptomyces sp. SN-593]BBA98295.1 hypothetical protein RVR_10508 [Streptomyces sp. SN-593]